MAQWLLSDFIIHKHKQHILYILACWVSPMLLLKQLLVGLIIIGSGVCKANFSFSNIRIHVVMVLFQPFLIKV